MNDNKEVAVQGERAALVPMVFNEEQVELIKKTVAKGTTNDELSLFLYTCKRTGLDPLIRQIYAVKRGGASNQMSIQTGIDGYRLIAERTGKYAPGREPSFKEEGGKIISATAYVKKLVAGEWHEVAATAYFDEYAQKFNGQLGNMWAKMGHVMISKCAEALALRRAFPAEMAGVYTHEEMAQADVVEVIAQPTERKGPQQAEHTPTIAELEAIRLKKAEEFKKANPVGINGSIGKAPVQAPQQAQEPIKEPFTATGFIMSMSEANKGGFVKVFIEDQLDEDGKQIGFSSKDNMILETIKGHMDKGEKVTLEYTVTTTGRWTNFNIVGLVVTPEPVEAQPGD